MWAYSRLAIIVLGLVGIAACEKDNLASPDAGFSCSVDTDCTMPGIGVCDTAGDKTCVECLPGAAVSTCTGMKPVCDATRSCRACKAHSDCASDACLPDGSCAMESQVGYVVAGGTGANCEKSAPCGSVATALDKTNATTKNIIRVTGLIENSNVDLDNRIRIFLGAPGTVLRGGQAAGGTNDAPIFTVRGRSKITAYDIEFRDARRVGIRVADGGTELTLVRSKIVNAQQEGLIIADGVATLTQSEVSTSGDANRYGINLQDGQLIADRSVIAENRGGGILMTSGRKAIVTNSFIVGNKAGGGVNAQQPSVDTRFEFNTIVDNISGNTALEAGGILCNTAAASVRNNIIYRNTGGTGGTVQRLGVCNSTGSYELSAGATDDTLKFKGDTMTPKDYHLTSASPNTVRDVPGVTCTGLKDYDGEDRPQPQGGLCDLGADEVK